VTVNPRLLQLYHSLPSLPFRSFIEQHRKAIVFYLSAVSGIVYGMLRPDWQVAVEPAQVIAGLVTYPLNNPFYIYQAKVWTILHQLAAIGLRSSLSEGQLSLIYSGLAGGLAFAGIALWTLAFSESLPVAVLMPFYVMMIIADRAVDWGINYPLMLIGQSHTYGMVGLTFIFLTTALFGLGEYKWGAFLLALTPAVHPSLGVWCILIVLICLAWDYQSIRPQLPSMLRFGIAGGLITLASLIFHFAVTYHVPKIDPAVANQYLSTFLRSWDEHRIPIDLYSPRTIITVMAAALSLTGLQFLRPTLPAHSHFLLRSVLVATTLGLGLNLINQFAFRLPDSVLLFMPTRLLNFNNLAYLPVLVGLMWRYRDRLWISANLLLMLGLSYFTFTLPAEQMRLFNFSGTADQMSLLILSGLAFVLVFAWGNWPLSLLLAYVTIALLFPPAQAAPSQGVLLSLTFFASAFLVQLVHSQADGPSFLKWAPAALLLLNAISVGSRAYDSRYNISNFWNSRGMLDSVPRGDGLIALGSDTNKVQLYSRRPVLLDPGALDMLPYAPEGGPEFGRILLEVYGIDFFNSPGAPSLPIEPARTIWQSRTVEDWQKIRQEFNVTHVMTTPDWILQLPQISQTPWGYIVYEIP